MAKQTRKSAVVHNEGGQVVEEIFDDNLLPDASDISKLKQLDPDIINWLKSRAEQEQTFRHKYHSRRIRLVERDERGSRWVNYLGMFFSFLLLSGFGYLSYFLISENHEVLGSIFSGAILIAIAQVFLSKVITKNSK